MCVEWIRNTSLLIQILFIYFGLGVFFSLSPMVVSVFALSFFSGAYITEIIRAGIQSMHKGQREAAFSMFYFVLSLALSWSVRSLEHRLAKSY